MQELLSLPQQNKNESLASGYYRSRLFTCVDGPNQLLTASQPLMLILGKINNDITLAEEIQSQQFLEHEFLAFKATAAKYMYPTETITLAEWILNTSIHDKCYQTQILQNNRKKTLSEKRKNNIYNYFNIIDKIILDPTHHIDLLELIYICMQLGCFDQCPENIQTKKQEMTHNMYKVIRNNRGTFKNSLYCNAIELSLKEKISIPKINLKYWLASILISCGIYIGAYKIIDLTLLPSINKIHVLHQQIETLKLT